MDFDIVDKLIFGSITAIGTIAAMLLNFRQAAKVKAELLVQFEEAIKRNQKHSATELFRLIHGLRMNYNDIKALIRNDNCSKIIYALKKTPGIVKYDNGSFQFTGFGGNRIFRFFDKLFTKFGIVLFGTLIIVSIFCFSFGKGGLSFLGFAGLIISCLLFTFNLRQHRYDQMIETLVNTTP